MISMNPSLGKIVTVSSVKGGVGKTTLTTNLAGIYFLMNKKVLRIIQNVATYLFIGLCLVLVIVTIVSKKSDGAINVFGHQARIVVSESMEKCDKTDSR